MKIYAYLALAVVLFGAIGGGARWAYTSGYNARDIEVQQDILDAQDKARVEEEEKWKGAVAKAKGTIIIEEKIVEKIREVEKRIPTVVEKIITITPECADLGPDFLSVLNDQIRAANSIQDAEGSAGMVEAVP